MRCGCVKNFDTERRNHSLLPAARSLNTRAPPSAHGAVKATHWGARITAPSAAVDLPKRPVFVRSKVNSGSFCAGRTVRLPVLTALWSGA